MEKKNEPRDPSLALCQICDNADMLIPARDMDGHIRQFRPCWREVEGGRRYRTVAGLDP